MKKLIILFAFFALFFGQKGFSQTWNTTSPKIIYAVDSLGDTANVKVGIGTANPQDKLDIAGNVKVKGQLTVDSLVIHQTKTDSIVTTAITGTNDSSVRFGHDAIFLNYATNTISWSQIIQDRPCLRLPPFEGLAIGNLGTVANPSNSMALGTNVQVQCPAKHSIVMGYGTPLVNSLENTLMVGFYSNIPTFYVGPSTGSGTTGMVGIGTTNPISALHVANSPNIMGYITTDPLNVVFAPVLAAPTDGVVIADNSGTLNRKINFNGNPNEALLGNGLFGPVGTGNVSSCAAASLYYLPKFTAVGPNPVICNSQVIDNGTNVVVNAPGLYFRRTNLKFMVLYILVEPMHME